MYSSPVLPAGLHTLVVTVTGTHDATSTANTVEIDSAIVSEVGPTTGAALSPNPVNGYYAHNPTVTLTAGDAGGPGIASTFYNVDGAATNSTYTVPFAITGDGTHTVTYYSTDTAGAVEATHTLTVTVDTTAPTTTASVSPTPSAGQVNGLATVTLTATDATSGVATTSYSVDGATAQTYTAPFTITTGGVHTVTYHSVDQAGNIEATQTLMVQVNPQVTTSPGGNVPSTLAISLTGAAPTFGAYAPGVAATYSTSVAATVTTTAQSSTLIAADACTPAAGCFPGHLVNPAAGGPYALAQGLQVDATSGSPSASGGGSWVDLSQSNPATILTYTAPVSNDAVAVGFRQPIAATDPLRTGTYNKTITLTLSTSTP